ncbi:hypothetical protein BPA30113_07085 [Burkholderia paludis]|uniref:Uncharacterized protein n=1 Tax=Burkholderia paludis TaxID=1506587 RepID=A0A6P2SJ14_9BURK|nr:hypothetical protein LMG30113_06737 [Burkholderia paludis]VWC43206.1 hypothetical protein BPA30113_07085 [Burkholderia paludis]
MLTARTNDTAGTLLDGTMQMSTGQQLVHPARSHHRKQSEQYRDALLCRAHTIGALREGQTMNRRIAVVGDSLTSGGTIDPYGGPPFLVHGHQAALIGGSAFCIACQSTGIIAKADGPYRLKFQGEIALDREIGQRPPPFVDCHLARLPPPPNQKNLAVERSGDGTGGRHTAQLGRAWSRNHCSNHSGLATGANPRARATPCPTAPGGLAFSKRLSFGYFSLARQRKVTATPRRGDANRPTRSQVLHENPGEPRKKTYKNSTLNPSHRARRAPLHVVRPHPRSASRATLADPPEA